MKFVKSLSLVIIAGLAMTNVASASTSDVETCWMDEFSTVCHSEDEILVDGEVVVITETTTSVDDGASNMVSFDVVMELP